MAGNSSPGAISTNSSMTPDGGGGYTIRQPEPSFGGNPPPNMNPAAPPRPAGAPSAPAQPSMNPTPPQSTSPVPPSGPPPQYLPPARPDYTRDMPPSPQDMFPRFGQFGGMGQRMFNPFGSESPFGPRNLPQGEGIFNYTPSGQQGNFDPAAMRQQMMDRMAMHHGPRPMGKQELMNQRPTPTPAVQPTLSPVLTPTQPGFTPYGVEGLADYRARMASATAGSLMPPTQSGSMQQTYPDFLSQQAQPSAGLGAIKPQYIR